MGEIMLTLASLAKQYEQDFYAAYQHKMSADHYHALRSLMNCRTPACGEMRYDCEPCSQHQSFYHSCGHRSCPQCQHVTNNQWLAKQQQKLLPVNYSMVTFTLPFELRELVWRHQKQVYPIFFEAVIDTLNTFSENDKQLRGKLGMTMVLHTHSRRLAFHPHIHVLIPAGVFNSLRTCWREKNSHYLFNGKALASVFRAKFMARLKSLELKAPHSPPQKWVAQCQSVGRGEPALKYLARYLYRGVLNEKNILKHQQGQITFRYKDSQSNHWKNRTESAVEFLWLVLQHVLPKGFRRTRDYGFLHGNAKAILQKLQLTLKVVLDKLGTKKKSGRRCPCCHTEMIFTAFFKRPNFKFNPSS